MAARTAVYVSDAVRMAASRSRCPGCNASLTGARGMTLHKAPAETPTPRAGDVTVCAYCGEILQYLFDYTLGRLAQDELDKLPAKQRRLVVTLSETTKKRPLGGVRK